MNLNEDELLSQMDKYFKNKSKEEIIRDIIKAGGASLFDLEEPEKNYTVVYISKENYNDSLYERSDFIYKSKQKAINEALKKGYRYDKYYGCYRCEAGDNSLSMLAIIDELIVVE